MRQRLIFSGTTTSKQAINKRINKKTVALLKLILKDVLRVKMEKITSAFSSIIITDSTSYELPECLAEKYKGFGGNHGVRAGVKIQHQFSITDGKSAVKVVSATENDFKTTLICPKKNELHLFDLGYFEFSRFNEFEQKEAFYLCRLKLSTVVWVKKNGDWEKLNWEEINRKIQVHEVIEFAVCLGNNKEVTTRMFVKKLSPEIAARKRKEVKRYCQRHKDVPTQKRLALCDLSIHISNLSAEILNKEDAHKIYSLRWQIELQFKTWKSYMNIDKVAHMRLHRFECHLYGCLIYCLLTAKLLFSQKVIYWKKSKKELSELKAMKFLSGVNQLVEKLFWSEQKIRDDTWENITETLIKTCIKETKKQKENPIKTILTRLS